jgi:magnesium-transporting ATPase (P-type)
MPVINPRKFFLDLARHAMPLVSLYWLDGSIAGYLLLTAFNLSLGLMLIVGLTRDSADPTTVDPRAQLPIARLSAVLILSVFLAATAAIVTVPIFMPAYIFSLGEGVDWWGVLSRGKFWGMVAFVSLIAGFRGQLGFEAVTTVGERGTSPKAAPVIGDIAQDRRRSRADYAAQVTVMATFVFVSLVMTHLGSWGFYILPVAYTALLVFFDTRPDWGRKIFPEMWQPEKVVIRKASRRSRSKR